jgi:hypothetical protein
VDDARAARQSFARTILEYMRDHDGKLPTEWVSDPVKLLLLLAEVPSTDSLPSDR